MDVEGLQYREEILTYLHLLQETAKMLFYWIILAKPILYLFINCHLREAKAIQFQERLMLNPEQLSRCDCRIGGNLAVLASNLGYGFVVKLGDLQTKNKSGKAALNARMLSQSHLRFFQQLRKITLPRLLKKAKC